MFSEKRATACTPGVVPLPGNRRGGGGEGEGGYLMIIPDGNQETST
jgi:hypothetical protein